MTTNQRVSEAALVTALLFLVALPAASTADPGPEPNTLTLEAPYEGGIPTFTGCFQAVGGGTLIGCPVVGAGEPTTGRIGVAGLLPPLPGPVTPGRACLAPGFCARGAGLLQTYVLPDRSGSVEHTLSFTLEAADAHASPEAWVRIYAWASATHSECSSCGETVSKTLLEGTGAPHAGPQSLVLAMPSPPGPVPPGNVTLRFLVDVSFLGSQTNGSGEGTARVVLDRITASWTPSPSSDCDGADHGKAGQDHGNGNGKPPNKGTEQRCG